MSDTNTPGAERSSGRSSGRRAGPLRLLAGYHWAEALTAILGGNIIYLFIEPELPSIFRHHLFRVDLGLGVDFLICACAYFLLRELRSPGGDRAN